MSRILIHEPDKSLDHRLSRFAGQDREVVVCRGREALVRALAEGRPDVLVYAIGDLAADLVLLGWLRGAAPKLPMIPIGGPTDLAGRRAIQELKPTYYGVPPLDDAELDDAIRGALQRGLTRA